MWTAFIPNLDMEKAINITLEGMHNNPEILVQANIYFCAFEKFSDSVLAIAILNLTTNSITRHQVGQCHGLFTYCVILAEGRIQKWEREALKNCLIPLLIWKHYVDDMVRSVMIAQKTW